MNFAFGVLETNLRQLGGLVLVTGTGELSTTVTDRNGQVKDKTMRIELEEILGIYVVPPMSILIVPAWSAICRRIACCANKRADVSCAPESADSKFVNEFQMATVRDAASGIDHLLDLGTEFVMPPISEGVEKIKAEIENLNKGSESHCTADERKEYLENLQYILNKESGSSSKTFKHAGDLKRDCDEAGNVHPDRKLSDGTRKRFDDFVHEAQTRTKTTSDRESPLHEPHALALRLYTTSTYKLINKPMRKRQKHPLPITVKYLMDGIRYLRGADELDELGEVNLFRGMQNMNLPETFLKTGGTEAAPMSTTTDLRVAVNYCRNSSSSLMFKIKTVSCLERGADLGFLSAFPNENDFFTAASHFLDSDGPLAGNSVQCERWHDSEIHCL
eukprot:4449055-Prymnesium_polylepis.1